MRHDTKKWLELEHIPKLPEERSKGPFIHLFVKGQNRVECMPTVPMGQKTATIYPSKVTCKNCIKRLVYKKKHKD